MVAEIRRWLTILALVVLGAAPAHAKPPTALELGVYTPRLSFKDNLARKAWAAKVAQALSTRLGRPVVGRAFTRFDDVMTFVRARRLHLVLMDAGALAGAAKHFEVIAAGSGPEGRHPPFGVFAPKPVRGLKHLEGKRLATVSAGPKEPALLSNFAFEGELALSRYFSKVTWSAELGEVHGWLRSGRADATLSYVREGRAAGFHLVARLQPMPLPMLAAVRGAVSPKDREQLTARIPEEGLPLPAAGPLSMLRRFGHDTVQAMRAAVDLPPGQRPVRRAVWSPVPAGRLPVDAYRTSPRGTYPLPAIGGRLREPRFPEL